MTIQSNLLIQNIEAMLQICQDILWSEDAIRLQQQNFSFKHVTAEELLLTEITRALSEQISDENILSYFRMFIRYSLVEQKKSIGGSLSLHTIELLQEAV